MCIDGTRKFEEELDENFQFAIGNRQAASKRLKLKFSEIKEINESLLDITIPCLIISVIKNRKGHIKELHEDICELEEARGIKMILYVEHTVDPSDLPTALWRFCNNLDPKRDFYLVKTTKQSHDQTIGAYTACIGFDGTRKTKEFDDFNREWPNIIVADDATISAVDNKWGQLGIGQFIPSPSLRFKAQLYGENAAVTINN